MIKLILLVTMLSLPGLGAGREEGALISGMGARLTVNDLQTMVYAMPAEALETALTDESKLASYIDAFYLTKVLAHRAKKQGLHKHKEVAAVIENDSLNTLAFAKIRYYLGTELEIPDLKPAAREYYQANQGQFTHGPKFDVAHILLENKTEEKALAVTKRAHDLVQRIKSGALAFEAAAKEFSEDEGSAAKGGHIGWVGLGDTVPGFEKALLEAVDKGVEITGPAESRFGLHIIKINEYKPASPIPFEVVEQDILSEFRAKYRENAKAEYLARIRESASPDYESLNKHLLKLIKERRETSGWYFEPQKPANVRP